MLDNTENTNEGNVDEGVKVMSLSDTLNYSSTGEMPEIEPEAPEAEIEPEAHVSDEPETNTDVESDVVEAVETPKEEIVEPKTDVKEEKDPYEGIDEEDRAYYDFKKRNKGTTRVDFEDSLIDYDRLDRKDLLRKSLREKYNISDSDEQLDEYIAEELGIPMDAEVDEMTVTERVRLRKETDDFIKSKKEQHSKWSENKTETNVAKKEQQQEMVRLENGSEIPKAQYDTLVQKREEYVKNNKETLNRVQETSFTFSVKDDNGEVREYSGNYKFDKEDKNRILSISSDAVKHFNETYQTEKGVDHESLNINKAWEDPITRGKMLSHIAKTQRDEGRAEGIEEALSTGGNVTLGGNKGLQQQETKGYKVVPLKQYFNN